MILVLVGLPSGENIRESANVFFLYHIGGAILSVNGQDLQHMNTITRVLPDTMDSEKLVEWKSQF